MTNPSPDCKLMVMNYWLVKQEPEAYAWTTFVREGGTAWTGIRNFQARNYLQTMKKGDRVLFYHSVTGKTIMGIAEVSREAYPDPTADQGDWSAVDLAPVETMQHAVTLEEIKADSVLKTMPLIRQSRLSVMPLSERQYLRVLRLGKPPKETPR